MFRQTLLGAFVGLYGLFATAHAQAADAVYELDIAAGDSVSVLNALARQSQTPLLFDYDQIRNVPVNKVSGRYTLQEALDVILQDTGFTGHLLDREVIVISPAETTKTSTKDEDMKFQGKARLLGAASAAILTTAAAMPTLAQTADEDFADVVVATGIRQSLETARDIKRDSSVIQDSIRAEAIGRLPATNVAEALQTIPGVAIDRTSGEGQRVTVRGFGPDFNAVLINGRRSASSSIAGVGGAADDNVGASLSNRGFNFDVISADLIGGIDVYKTTSVELQEGGIGSTIDLQTLRPLSFADDKYLVSAKGTINEVGGDFSPSLFAFASKKFLDGRLGLLGSVSYQDRTVRRETLSVNGYVPTTVTEGQTSGIGPGVDGDAGLYYVPQQTSLTINDQERKRLGLTGTVEFLASDSVTVTLDGIYSQLDVDSTVDQLSNFYFFNGSNLENVVTDGNNTFTSFDNTNRFVAYNGRAYTRPTSLISLGGNVAWDVTDNLAVDLDVSYSKADDTSDKDGGGGRFAVIRERTDFSFDNSSGIPFIDAPNGFGVDPDGLTTFVLGRFGEGVEDEILEFKGSAAYRFDDSIVREFRAGAQYAQQERFNNVVEQADGIGFYAFPGAARVTVPGNLVSTPSTSGILSGASDVRLPANYVSYDIDALLGYLGTDAAFTARDNGLGLEAGTSASAFAARGGFDATQFPATSFGVDEDIFALYTELELGDDQAKMPWTVNLGVRYVETETTASGFEDTITDIRALQPGGTSYLFERAAAVPVSVTNKYTNVLPSVNARLDVTDEIVLRAAFSQSLTRPVLTDLAPRIDFGSQVRPGNFVINAGNPNLQPFVSDNFDASFEWYYNPASFLSIGGFKKNVDGFVVTRDFTESFQIANIDNIANEPNISGNTATFVVRRPDNTNTASVEGVEVSWQHTFDSLPGALSGLGVQANAIFVSSDAEFNASNTANNFALPGLGDSQNFVLFYENDRYGARLSYNIRDEFLRAAATGPGSEPAFVRKYDQLDFRVTAQINDTFEVFADGTNILGEEIRQRGRFDNQFLLLEETGARYSLGVRGSF